MKTLEKNPRTLSTAVQYISYKEK